MKATPLKPAARPVASLLLALSLIAGPTVARAHANPDHADPKVGSTVTGPPSHVRIWFDSDLEPALSSIAVHAPGGARVDSGHGRVDPTDHKLLEVDVPQLAPGTYRVLWSVVGRDGHRTSGDYTFTIR